MRDHHPRAPRVSRWSTAAAYWAAQTVVYHLLVAQWSAPPGSDWSERLAFLGRPEVLAMSLPVALLLAACQAVLLMPADFTGAGRASPPAVWAARLTCGVAIGGLVAMASFAAVWAAASLTSFQPPGAYWWGAGTFAVFLASGAAAVLWLATTSPGGVPAWVRAVVASSFAAAAAAGVAASACALVAWLRGEDGAIDRRPTALLVLGAGCVSWTLWTPLLLVFLRRPTASTGLARAARAVFAGSVLHAAALIPLNVMVRRKTQCYCGESSLWSLSVTLGVGLFSLGPAVFLVPFAARRAAMRRGLCPRCGYDLSALPPPKVCPECGPQPSDQRYTAAP